MVAFGRNSLEKKIQNIMVEGGVTNQPIIEGLHFNCISNEQKEDLEKPFLEEEVLVALLCPRKKAPRPYGFLMKFLKVLGCVKRRCYGNSDRV